MTTTTLGNRIVAKRVTKTISTVTLLAPVSLVAEPGRCLVLRGPNGAGKTTLLRILGGLVEPTEGTATIDERVVDERDPATRAAVAALLGAPVTYRDLTLRDHLTLVDATWGQDYATSNERVDAALEAHRIAHLAQRFPHELSSGQSQLFRLCLTFFRPSTTLLLDEPEQRLDTAMRALVGEQVRARCEGGTTVVMACHDPELTKAVADKVITINPVRS